jgi:PAB-dependent poly(A)-specific ribonuclease subunit 3
MLTLQLQYHLYTSPPPKRRQDLNPNQRTTADFFIPDDLRETLQRKNEAAQRVFLDTSLPKNIKGYHSLVPLDTSRDSTGSIRRFGYPSWVYKADSTKFGKKYALRRLENYKLTNEDSIANVQKWRRVKSACVVAFHEAFTTKAFEDDSIVFVYDYHADSKSLAQLYFSADHLHGKQHRSSQHYHHHATPQVPEKLLWGYITQIATGLKTIHDQNLACRVLDLSTLLVTSDRRLRLNCCGIMDVIAPLGEARMAGEQLGDLANFGRYMLCLATNSVEAVHDPGRWLEVVKRRSGNLGGALSYLVNLEGNMTRNINEFLANISDVLVSFVDASLQYTPPKPSFLLSVGGD